MSLEHAFLSSGVPEASRLRCDSCLDPQGSVETKQDVTPNRNAPLHTLCLIVYLILTDPAPISSDEISRNIAF